MLPKRLDWLLAYPTAWQVFGWILMHAHSAPCTVAGRRGPVDLERGECFLSSRVIASTLGIGRERVRRALKLCRKWDLISTRETTRNGTVITVLDYGQYWNDISPHNPENNPENNPLATHSQPTRNPLTRNSARIQDFSQTDRKEEREKREKEEKKEKNQKKEKKKEREEREKKPTPKVPLPVAELTEKDLRKRKLHTYTQRELAVGERVLAKLSERSGRTYGVNKTNMALLARLLRDPGEPASEHDLRVVIWHRYKKWQGTCHEEYLRPTTLFGPENFYSKYLPAARAAYAEREAKRSGDELRERERVTPLSAVLGGAPR